LIVVLLGVGSNGAHAQTDQPTPTALPDVPYQWQPVVTGLNSPLLLVTPPDGSGRMFVGEQDGVIFVIENGKLIDTPFLDVGELLTDDVFQGGYTERGLLGLAFHPDFKTNDTFYIYYINKQNETVIARYRVSKEDRNRANPVSTGTILTVKHPFENHKGGQITFGPDGYLYIGIGDGGSLGDPQGNGQNLGTLLGKILRIDVNKTEGEKQYAIPPDNPFVNGKEGARPEIWAYGVRNPWRFSFDRKTGDLYIGEVGEARFEEIDFQAAGSKGGQNYGWNKYEGATPFGKGVTMDGISKTTLPMFIYPHSVGCSVTGGYVYRGKALPALDGAYIFGDYCFGRVWLMRRADSGDFATQLWMNTERQISAFGQDAEGEVYLVDFKGMVLKLTAK
jgi:glucose/arabinose dehydrogenase